jgi:hypothetical protein
MTSLSARRRWRPASLLTWILAVPCAWIVGCVYDADDRCSEGQTVVEHDRCACEPGLVAVDGVCQPCPLHQIEQNGSCVCEEGFARADANSECITEAPGLDVPCADADECVEEPFTHCQSHDLGGYCTSADCASSEDCPVGYACDTEAAPAYCKRPPVGQAAACQNQADCAEYEATFCEEQQGHVCLVQGCDGATQCFEGWQCCDLTAFGLPFVCVPEGECPTS